jgi:hypothetical protein
MVFDTLIHSTQKREALVKPVIHRLIQEELKGPFSPARSFGAYVCSGRHGVSRDAHMMLLRRGEYYVQSWGPSYRAATSTALAYFEDVNRTMKAMNLSRALKDVYEARLYIFVYGDRRSLNWYVSTALGPLLAMDRTWYSPISMTYCSI